MKQIFNIILSIWLVISITITNTYCYGYPTLFKSKSHAQRYLQTDNQSSVADLINSPSSISLPQDTARVVESYKGKGDSLIIHIQDRHTDPVAQLNIAAILDEFVAKYDTQLMCLEGASKALDTSFYDNFPDNEIKEKVAKFFVEKGLFTGAEYYKITHKDRYLKAEGVEDKEAYLEHLASYKASGIDKDNILKFLKAVSISLNTLKGKVYSNELKDLDKTADSYSLRQIKLPQYLTALETYSKKAGLDISKYKNLDKFIRLVDKEKRIDFKKAESQREALIRNLSEVLEKNELDMLINNSLQFRLGKLAQEEFYDYLYSLIEKGNLDRASYKDLIGYINYIKFSKNINHLAVYNEAEDLEEKVKLALCKTSTQRNLVKYSKATNMLKDLYNLRLTRRQLDYIEKLPQSFNIPRIQNFLKTTYAKYGLTLNPVIASTLIDQQAVEHFRKYYQIALKRDIALVDNTLKSMKKSREDKAVLIAGGFHTQGVTGILKDKDISYIVICPNIGPEDYEQLYSDRMAGKLPDAREMAEFFSHTLAAPLITSDMSRAETVNQVKYAFALSFGLSQDRQWGTLSNAAQEDILLELWDALAQREGSTLYPHDIQEIIEATVTARAEKRKGAAEATKSASAGQAEETVLTRRDFIKKAIAGAVAGAVSGKAALGVDKQAEIDVAEALKQRLMKIISDLGVDVDKDNELIQHWLSINFKRANPDFIDFCEQVVLILYKDKPDLKDKTAYLKLGVIEDLYQLYLLLSDRDKQELRMLVSSGQLRQVLTYFRGLLKSPIRVNIVFPVIAIAKDFQQNKWDELVGRLLRNQVAITQFDLVLLNSIIHNQELASILFNYNSRISRESLIERAQIIYARKTFPRSDLPIRSLETLKVVKLNLEKDLRRTKDALEKNRIEFRLKMIEAEIEDYQENLKAVTDLYAGRVPIESISTLRLFKIILLDKSLGDPGVQKQLSEIVADGINKKIENGGVFVFKNGLLSPDRKDSLSRRSAFYNFPNYYEAVIDGLFSCHTHTPEGIDASKYAGPSGLPGMLTSDFYPHELIGADGVVITPMGMADKPNKLRVSIKVFWSDYDKGGAAEGRIVDLGEFLLDYSPADAKVPAVSDIGIKSGSAGSVEQALLEAAALLNKRPHPLLKTSDTGQNLRDKIEGLGRILKLSNEEEARLRSLIKRYFELERMVHRIKKDYISDGRIRLLSAGNWTIFSHSRLQRALQPIIWSDIATGEGSEYDFLSMYGIGAGLETAADIFFGSNESVSLNLEGFNRLDGRPGSDLQHTGIAVVYSKELEKAIEMMAVDAPDEDYLLKGFGDYLSPEQEERLKKEVLTPEGIRDLREEMIVRRGRKMDTLPFLGIMQGPFDEREVMAADGIPSAYIEAIVVADDIYDRFISINESLPEKVIKASEYFSADNERLNELTKTMREIVEIIQPAEEKTKAGKRPMPEAEQRKASSAGEQQDDITEPPSSQTALANFQNKMFGIWAREQEHRLELINKLISESTIKIIGEDTTEARPRFGLPERTVKLAAIVDNKSWPQEQHFMIFTEDGKPIAVGVSSLFLGYVPLTDWEMNGQRFHLVSFEHPLVKNLLQKVKGQHLDPADNKLSFKEENGLYMNVVIPEGVFESDRKQLYKFYAEDRLFRRLCDFMMENNFDFSFCEFMALIPSKVPISTCHLPGRRGTLKNYRNGVMYMDSLHEMIHEIMDIAEKAVSKAEFRKERELSEDKVITRLADIYQRLSEYIRGRKEALQAGKRSYPDGNIDNPDNILISEGTAYLYQSIWAKLMGTITGEPRAGMVVRPTKEDVDIFREAGLLPKDTVYLPDGGISFSDYSLPKTSSAGAEAAMFEKVKSELSDLLEVTNSKMNDIGLPDVVIENPAEIFNDKIDGLIAKLTAIDGFEQMTEDEKMKLPAYRRFIKVIHYLELYYYDLESISGNMDSIDKSSAILWELFSTVYPPAKPEEAKSIFVSLFSRFLIDRRKASQGKAYFLPEQEEEISNLADLLNLSAKETKEEISEILFNPKKFAVRHKKGLGIDGQGAGGKEKQLNFAGSDKGKAYSILYRKSFLDANIEELNRMFSSPLTNSEVVIHYLDEPQQLFATHATQPEYSVLMTALGYIDFEKSREATEGLVERKSGGVLSGISFQVGQVQRVFGQETNPYDYHHPLHDTFAKDGFSYFQMVKERPGGQYGIFIPYQNLLVEPYAKRVQLYTYGDWRPGIGGVMRRKILELGRKGAVEWMNQITKNISEGAWFEAYLKDDLSVWPSAVNYYYASLKRAVAIWRKLGAAQTGKEPLFIESEQVGESQGEILVSYAGGPTKIDLRDTGAMVFVPRIHLKAFIADVLEKTRQLSTMPDNQELKEKIQSAGGLEQYVADALNVVVPYNEANLQLAMVALEHANLEEARSKAQEEVISALEEILSDTSKPSSAGETMDAAIELGKSYTELLKDIYKLPYDEHFGRTPNRYGLIIYDRILRGAEEEKNMLKALAALEASNGSKFEIVVTTIEDRENLTQQWGISGENVRTIEQFLADYYQDVNITKEYPAEQDKVIKAARILRRQMPVGIVAAPDVQVKTMARQINADKRYKYVFITSQEPSDVLIDGRREESFVISEVSIVDVLNKLKHYDEIVKQFESLSLEQKIDLLVEILPPIADHDKFMKKIDELKATIEAITQAA